MSTPKPETPWPTPVRRRAVRRGGKRRFATHRRLSTCMLDRSMPNQCAYQCVLRAAGMAVTMKAVMQLRASTADMIYDAYINYEEIAGINVREIVQASDLTLSAYLTSIRNSQWASVAEAAAAPQVCQVDMAIQTEDVYVLSGLQPRHCMKLRKCHWRLYRSRSKTSKPSHVKVSSHRGGMPSLQGDSNSAGSPPDTPIPESQLWTWEQSEPC